MGAAHRARRGDRVQLNGRRRAFAITLAADWAVFWTVVGAGAVLAQSGYLPAVRAAEGILSGAHVSAAEVRRADSVLFAGVGCSQPVIAGDLSS